METLKHLWEIVYNWFISGQAWQWLCDNVLSLSLWIIGIIGTALLTKFVNKILDWINTKTKSEKVKKLIEKAKDIIHSVTDATTQNFVSNLKKRNQFTLEQQKIAFEKTLSESTALLTSEVQKAIKSEYKDVESFIGNEIESYLHSEKGSK